jgi:hypothetical protein
MRIAIAIASLFRLNKTIEFSGLNPIKKGTAARRSLGVVSVVIGKASWDRKIEVIFRALKC